MSDERIDRDVAAKERGLLEQDYATPCPSCGGVVFEWWDSDTCRDCEGNDEASSPEQTTLVSDGGTSQHAGENESPFDGCPECGGPLGYQSRSDLVCRVCGEEYCHETRGGRDLLWSFTLEGRLDEVVARA